MTTWDICGSCQLRKTGGEEDYYEKQGLMHVAPSKTSNPSSSSICTAAATKNLASACPGVQLVAVRASGVRSSGGLGLSRALVVSRLGPAGQSYPPARSRPATRKETSSSASHQSQLAARILGVFPSRQMMRAHTASSLLPCTPYRWQRPGQGGQVAGTTGEFL